jgi:hypothetical protein
VKFKGDKHVFLKSQKFQIMEPLMILQANASTSSTKNVLSIDVVTLTFNHALVVE